MQCDPGSPPEYSIIFFPGGFHLAAFVQPKSPSETIMDLGEPLARQIERRFRTKCSPPGELLFFRFKDECGPTAVDDQIFRMDETIRNGTFASDLCDFKEHLLSDKLCEPKQGGCDYFVVPRNNAGIRTGTSIPEASEQRRTISDRPVYHILFFAEGYPHVFHIHPNQGNTVRCLREALVENIEQRSELRRYPPHELLFFQFKVECGPRDQINRLERAIRNSELDSCDLEEHYVVDQLCDPGEDNGYDYFVIPLSRVIEGYAKTCPKMSSAWELERTRQTVLSDFREEVVTSSTSKPTVVGSGFERNHILAGRPFHYFGLPVTLYHPIFHEFLRHLETVTVDADHVEKTCAYMKECMNFYDSESDLRDAAQSLLMDLIGPSQESISDDMISIRTHFIIARLEWKLEFGYSSPEDAVLQSIYGYLDFLANSTRTEKYHMYTNHPAFLIIVCGPWITVFGVILAERVLAEPLTDFIFCGETPSSRTPNILWVAKFFYALKLACVCLHDYYTGLMHAVDTGSLSVPVSQVNFPYITSYSTAGEEIPFVYQGSMRDDKAIFRAKKLTLPTRQIIVKFTKRYCEKAHQLLASHGLAPELLSITDRNHQDIMVVMEFIPNAEEYNRAFQKLDEQARKEVHEQVSQAVDLLHRSNFVFGDLRDSNILVTKNRKVFLIDFDWAGKEGEARYPPGELNPHVPWPPHTGHFQLITKQHDRYWFDLLSKSS